MSKRKIKTNDDAREFIATDLSAEDKKVVLSNEEILEKPVEVKKRFVGKKVEERKISQELKEIYRNSDGSMPDMGDFKPQENKKTMRAFLLLLMACLFLGVVTWLGLFLFPNQNKFSQNEVELKIDGPDTTVAGELVTYRINYDNKQNIQLTKASLQVRYPEGFVLESSSIPASTDKKDEWQIGGLEGNATGYIDLIGRLYGNNDQEQSFRVFLNYTPVNFSSEFQKVESLKVKVNKSPLEIKTNIPKEVAIGKDFLIELNLLLPEDNPEGIDLTNLALQMEAGVFSKLESEPKSDPENMYLWSLADVTSSKKIVIKGIINTVEKIDATKLIFKIVGWKNDERQDEPYTYLINEVDIKLVATNVSVSLAINGSTGDLTIEPGETLNTTIILKNVGQIPLKNVQVRLVFEGPSYSNKSIFDWGNIKDLADGNITGEQVNPESRRGIITWTKNNKRELQSVSTNGEVNLDLSLPVRSSQQIDLSQFTSYNGSALVEIKYDEGSSSVNTQSEVKILTSNKINIIFSSDLSLDVRDKIATSGSGLETHSISWVLGNTFHELKNVELGADIYGDVVWQADSLNVPAGKAEWDEKTKKLVWKIDRLPTDVDVLALQFAIGLNSKNPSQTNLTSKVTLKAVDSVTGQELIRVGDGVLLNN